MTQNAKILEHLRAGLSITPLEAMGLYGVYRLAARIKELRNLGHTIVTENCRDRTGRPYARYHLESQHAAA